MKRTFFSLSVYFYFFLAIFGSHCAAEGSPCSRVPRSVPAPCTAQGAGGSNRLGVRGKKEESPAGLRHPEKKKNFPKGNWCGRN